MSQILLSVRFLETCECLCDIMLAMVYMHVCARAFKTDILTERQTDRETEEEDTTYMYIQIYKQTYRQINKETNRPTYILFQKVGVL